MIKGTLKKSNSDVVEPETQSSRANIKNSRLRLKHRKDHFIKSSLHELVDQSCQSWINDPVIRDITNKELELLSLIKRNRENIFGFTKEDCKTRISKLANYVMVDSAKNLFINEVKDGAYEIHIKNESLLTLRNKMEQIFDINFEKEGSDFEGVLHTKVCAATQLLSFLVSLRLYKEVRDNKITLAIDLPSKQQAINDFEDLKNYIPELHNKKTNKKTDDKENAKENVQISFLVRKGNKAVDFFTKKERAKAGTNEHCSPHAVWNKDELATSLRKYFNAYFESKFRKAPTVVCPKVAVNNKVIGKHLAENYFVSQFPPSALFHLIVALKQKFQFTFDGKGGYVLDPCGGWGGRAVACFAHSEINNYTVVEPNCALTAIYHDMHQLYAPNKNLSTINKKIEDVELSDLKINGHDNDLAFTSPPYKDKEVYVTSKSDYADQNEWNKLLFSLLKTSDTLRPGGLLVLNVSADLGEDIEKNYKLNLREFANLNYLNFINGKTRGKRQEAGKGLTGAEIFMVFRREAYADLRPALPLRSAVSAREKPFLQINNYLTNQLGFGEVEKGEANRLIELLPHLDFSDDSEDAIDVEEYPIVIPEKQLEIESYVSNFQSASYTENLNGSVNPEAPLTTKKRKRIQDDPSFTLRDQSGDVVLPLAKIARPEPEINIVKAKVSNQQSFNIFEQISVDNDAIDIDELPSDLLMHHAPKKRSRSENDVHLPRKKQRLQDQLKTDTVEGKKSEGKFIYNFSRKAKEKAIDNIKAQIDMDEEPLAYMADIILSEPLLIRFKTRDVRSALPELFASEKCQIKMSPM